MKNVGNHREKTFRKRINVILIKPFPIFMRKCVENLYIETISEHSKETLHKDISYPNCCFIYFSLWRELGQKFSEGIPDILWMLVACIHGSLSC